MQQMVGGWNSAFKLAECSYRQRDMRLIILWQQKSRKQPDTADIGWNKCLPEWTMFQHSEYKKGAKKEKYMNFECLVL